MEKACKLPLLQAARRQSELFAMEQRYGVPEEGMGRVRSQQVTVIFSFVQLTRVTPPQPTKTHTLGSFLLGCAACARTPATCARLARKLVRDLCANLCATCARFVRELVRDLCADLCASSCARLLCRNLVLGSCAGLLCANPRATARLCQTCAKLLPALVRRCNS